MSSDLAFSIGRFPHAIRFVERLVRDCHTQLIYCDTQCFAWSAHEATRVVKDRERIAS